MKRPSLHLGVVDIEKGCFGSPLTKVANITLLIYIFFFNKKCKQEKLT